jgi:predicted HTH domain antitoxin
LNWVLENGASKQLWSLLRDGKVTFAKAAEIAKLSLWEFADLVKQRNIEWVRYTPEEIEKEFKEASAAESE